MSLMTDPAEVSAILSNTLDLLCACLEDTPNGAPDCCKMYHTKPPDDCCDFLAIWVDRIYPTIAFPEEYVGSIKCQQEIHGALEVGVKLSRKCWPVMQDNPNAPFPPSDETTDAASDLQIDAVSLWCCLENAALGGTLAAPLDGDCRDVVLGTMTPLVPMGGCAGWTFNYTIELSPCC